MEETRSISETHSLESASDPVLDPPTDHIKLSFTRNSVWNTIISSSDHEIMYEVSTPNRIFNSVTTITRLDKWSGERKYVGEIAWKAFKPLVRIGRDGDLMPVSQFLVNGKSKLSSARSFVGKYGLRYRWKIRKFTLLMCSDDQDDSSKGQPALVTFHTPDRKNLKVVEPARLLVSPTVLPSLDPIIISFLYVEKRRRDD
ncbi:hypothetical protein FRC03_008593 [Tulasnella sp. 419]|nr:hypothetical protein FRC03_008593 [Tulasnella sp. 419]